MHASIIIPCFNGGSRLKESIQACLNQKVNFEYEIITIDSESNDGSLEYLKGVEENEEKLKVFPILKSNFGHGKTRNYGASLANGKYLCFITQDAIPADENWLYNLIKPFETYPEAAGAFGRHLAHKDHSPYLAEQMNQHFDNFGNGTVAFKMDSIEHYESDTAYRQNLHFYSDNNSCMRKDIWEQFPYDDVPFGEDQLWADKIIRAGLTKLYISDAAVYHSHEFNIKESYIRASEEAVFFSKHFGYKIESSITAAISSALYLAKNEFNYRKIKNSYTSAILSYPMILTKHTASKMGHYNGTVSR